MARILVVDDSDFDLAIIKKAVLALCDWNAEFVHDGDEAFQKLQAEPFDLLLTDLHMPNVDGLSLLREIRTHGLDVPVVVMTSKSCDEMTVEAIRLGALNFVIKKHLIRELPATIDSVMRARSATKLDAIPMTCLREWTGVFSLPNDQGQFANAIALVLQAADHLSNLTQTDRTRLAMALDEALSNAMLHGNLETGSISARDLGERKKQIQVRAQLPPFCDRRIELRAHVTPNQLQCQITDEGTGFDLNTQLDPSNPDSMKQVSGRGLLLIRTLVDECQHNESGNQITITKRMNAGQAG